MSLETGKGFRRSHKKSRGGCLTCKGRRVKCDETRPVCLSCSRRSTECLWATGDNALASSSRSAVVPSLVNGTHSLKRVHAPKFNMNALSVLHHFTTSTALTFFDQPSYSLAIQTCVPPLAMSHPFLMHSLFAISNLHLHCLNAPLNQNTRHYHAAEEHFTLAIQGYQDEQSSHLTEVNLIFNFIMAMYMFARPTSDSIELPLQDTKDLLKQSRIFYRDLLIPWRAAEDGVLQTPLFPSDLPRSPELAAKALNFPLILQSIHLPTSGTPDSNEVADSRTSEVYYGAILGLMAGWTYVHGSNSYYARMSAIGWPSVLSDEFISFVDQHRPRALVIVAHWCAWIIMFKETWWIRDRGEKCLKGILQHLDRRWLPWMSIPIEILNCPKDPWTLPHAPLTGTT
ncbi:hypothetical protein DL96DRAFT_1618783 [Flagelloscypha sp. PMI_526]|nr:hypothetical protein DL96DRAFT_1618783 [Flagelloscypha sp. PMI_526]